LACVEAAQAGLIFRRGNRRGDDCGSYYSGNSYGYGYSGGMYGGQYAYSPMYTPMYSGAYTYGYGSPGTYAYGSPGTYGYGSTGNPMFGGPSASGYADPLGISAATGPITGDKARVRIHVPGPDARLWINNQMVQTGGSERVFDLPVNGGQAQKVTLTAQWMKDGREVVRKKEIDLRPGQEVDVTIRENDAATSNGEQLPVNPNPNSGNPNPNPGSSDAIKPKPDNP